jgi:hypothetical protein
MTGDEGYGRQAVPDTFLSCPECGCGLRHVLH